MKRRNLQGEDLKLYNYQHTQQRALERYEIALTKSDYTNICRRIKYRILVSQIKEECQKRGIQRIFKLNYKGRDIYAVYLDTTETVTTLLPPDDF